MAVRKTRVETRTVVNPLRSTNLLTFNRPNGVTNSNQIRLWQTAAPLAESQLDFLRTPFNGTPVSSLRSANSHRISATVWCRNGTSRSSMNSPGNMALEVGYLGNHQSHQLYQPDPNYRPTRSLHANSAINGTNTSLYPDIGGISGTASFGFGNYDAMTAKCTKRLSNGLQFQSAYTWGHALADTGTTFPVPLASTR